MRANHESVHRSMNLWCKLKLVGCAALWCICATASAQTVYRCEHSGSVVYSHEPCLGAKAVETTPTQGLDKSSGTSRKGADVRASESNRAMADALRPIFRETPEQREKRHWRMKLLPEEKLECNALDLRLTTQATSIRTVDPGSKAQAEAELLKTRSRFRQLRC